MKKETELSPKANHDQLPVIKAPNHKMNSEKQLLSKNKVELINEEDEQLISESGELTESSVSSKSAPDVARDNTDHTDGEVVATKIPFGSFKSASPNTTPPLSPSAMKDIKV